MSHDLELAFRMVDAADAVTAAAWSPDGVASSLKVDGSPVTEADLAAERAMLAGPRFASPDIEQQRQIERVIGGRPDDWPWSHQCRVAEGEIAA